ncbi:hypothetical protein MKX01_035857 [Papaver californicum]|nr:hypothetical protein MKX01_035857 [Papaver californicum]
MAKVVASTPLETTDSYVFMIDESGLPNNFKPDRIQLSVVDDDKALSVTGLNNRSVIYKVKFELPKSANADATTASVNGSLIISAKKLNRPKIVSKIVDVTKL